MNTPESPKNPNNLPWWRVGMVWLVLAGPAAVVVASYFTLRLALLHVDPVIKEPAAASESAPSLTPAVTARNHAATPAP